MSVFAPIDGTETKVNVAQRWWAQVFPVSLWLWGMHSHTLLPITTSHALEDINLLLEKTVIELTELEKEVGSEYRNSAETVLQGEVTDEVELTFSILQQIKCYSHHASVSQEFLREAGSVQEALRMLGHEPSTLAPCLSLEGMTLWEKQTKKFYLLQDLKTVLEKLKFNLIT
ncbi:hypothetical protein AOLI_G00064750 [Acnodon oligacanthus]